MKKRWVDFVKEKRTKHLIVRAVWEFVDLFIVSGTDLLNAFQTRSFRSTPGFLGKEEDFADFMT